MTLSMTHWGCVLVSLSVLGGCDGKKEHGSAAASGSASTASGSAAAPGPAAAATAAPGAAVAPATAAATGSPDAGTAAAPPPAALAPADDAAARAFVEAWRAAQDAGDFATYAAMYRKDFEGVRRSGTQIVRMRLARWLADRKKMFARPMKVEVADLAVVARDEGLEVRFTQTWASGKYKDRGPKLMTLVRDGDTWTIRREELLSSTIIKPGDDAVAAAPADAGAGAGASADLVPPAGSSTADVAFGLTKAGSAAELALAVVDPDTHEVLLGTTTGDFGVGPLSVDDQLDGLENGEVSARWLSRDVDAPPPAVAAATGLAVVVYDDALRPLCKGVLGDVFSLTNAGMGEPFGDDATPELTIWNDPPRIVQVSLDAPCQGSFVRAASLPPLTVTAPAAAAVKKLTKELRAAARDIDRGATPAVSVIAGPDGALYGSATFESFDTCTEHEGWHTVYATTTGRALPATDDELRLVAAVDLDGDGAVELVTSRGLLGDDWLPDLRVAPRLLGCDGYEGGGEYGD